MEETYWTAYFSKSDFHNCEVIGVNHAKKPVALEIKIEKGTIIFVPPSTHPKTGNILLTCILKSLKEEEVTPEPKWVKELYIHNEEQQIEQLRKIETDISNLKKTQSQLSNRIRNETRIKQLLYEKGKPLENIVEEAFREIGFSCEKKDDKDLIISSEVGEGILEVTGSEKSIDIKKLRQLLNYVLDETKNSSDEKKAILVANHFLNKSPSERGEPFSEKVILESKVHSICLLPTTDLFTLICKIRKNEITSKDAQKQIFDTIGCFNNTLK